MRPTTRSLPVTSVHPSTNATGVYGYENITHLRGIEVCDAFPALGISGVEHAQARVALEERHPRIPGRLLRLPTGRRSR